MTQQGAISRRRFVQATAASSLALAGLGFGRAARAQAAKPNIVFIMADDLSTHTQVELALRGALPHGVVALVGTPVATRQRIGAGIKGRRRRARKTALAERGAGD